MGSGVSHFNMSLIVRDTHQTVPKPQLFKKNESRKRLEQTFVCLPAECFTARPNQLTPKVPGDVFTPLTMSEILGESFHLVLQWLMVLH